VERPRPGSRAGPRCVRREDAEAQDRYAAALLRAPPGPVGGTLAAPRLERDHDAQRHRARPYQEPGAPLVELAALELEHLAAWHRDALHHRVHAALGVVPAHRRVDEELVVVVLHEGAGEEARVRQALVHQAARLGRGEAHAHRRARGDLVHGAGNVGVAAGRGRQGADQEESLAAHVRLEGEVDVDPRARGRREDRGRQPTYAGQGPEDRAPRRVEGAVAARRLYGSVHSHRFQKLPKFVPLGRNPPTSVLRSWGITL
jgi:hypothetical protein